MFLLEMQEITKRFTGVTALDKVGIGLKENETLAVLGGNGAGKSTLMRVLNGSFSFDSSCSGKIILNGNEQKFSSCRDAENVGIVMIYQEINLQLDLSAAENIFMGIFPRTKFGSISWKKAKIEAREILDSLNVQIDVTIPVRNFGASIQQLICIARALVRKPKVLILDEPTSCLTESETKHLMETIRKLKANGISSIYISHKLDEVMDIADRVVILRDGRNVSSYEKQQYDSQKIVEDMIGRTIENMYPKVEKVLHHEVLRVSDFTVSHPYATKKNIVEGVSFSVRKGEILGLAGLVGSGRSELLKAIFGATPKKKGKVYIEGKEVAINDPADALKNGIGLLTEDRKLDGLVTTMTIKENMTLASLKLISIMSVIRRKFENQLAEKYFKVLSIKARNMNDSIISLSGGNQQKVILSKLLMSNPKILFMDEPTRGIDIGAKNDIYKIIADLAAQGMSIVIISSELPELLEICDKYLLLSKGIVKMEMSKEEATHHKVLHLISGFDD
jgi:ABC-type sugar transport system, ATPase component